MATEINNNIPHTTVQHEYDVFGSVFNVTVICDTGYTIVGVPTMTVGGSFFNEVELTVAENKQSATGSIASDTEDTSIELYGETQGGSTPVEPTAPTVENNIIGTTETHTYENGNVSIHLMCEDTDKRYVGCKATYGDVSVDFPVTNSSDITVVLENVPTDANIILTGECRRVAVVNIDHLTGCSVTGVKPWYIENEKVSVNMKANNTTHIKTDH